MISAKLIRAEFLKLRGMRILPSYAALIGGSIGIVFFSFLNRSHQDFVYRNSIEQNPNPWYAYYSGYLFLLVFLLPVIASISTFIIKSVEDKADGWKRVYILPYRKEVIHLNKLLVIWSYVSLFVIVTFLILILSGLLLCRLKPDFQFSSHFNYHQILFIVFLKFELSVLSITAFSYAYMVLIKRTVVSLLLSIFLPFFCLLFINQYSSPLYQFFSLHRARISLIINDKAPDTLQVSFVSLHDMICIAILIVSLGIIKLTSEKLIVSYE